MLEVGFAHETSPARCYASANKSAINLEINATETFATNHCLNCIYSRADRPRVEVEVRVRLAGAPKTVRPFCPTKAPERFDSGGTSVRRPDGGETASEGLHDTN